MTRERCLTVTPRWASPSTPSPLSNMISGTTGFLNVSSVPPATVEVDDHDTGQMTPIEKLPLPEGDHKLPLISADKKVRRTVGFKIVSGQTTRLKINL